MTCCSEKRFTLQNCDNRSVPVLFVRLSINSIALCSWPEAAIFYLAGLWGWFIPNNGYELMWSSLKPFSRNSLQSHRQRRHFRQFSLQHSTCCNNSSWRLHSMCCSLRTTSHCITIRLNTNPHESRTTKPIKMPFEKIRYVVNVNKRQKIRKCGSTMEWNIDLCCAFLSPRITILQIHQHA